MIELSLKDTGRFKVGQVALLMGWNGPYKPVKIVEPIREDGKYGVAFKGDKKHRVYYYPESILINAKSAKHLCI